MTLFKVNMKMNNHYNKIKLNFNHMERLYSMLKKFFNKIN